MMNPNRFPLGVSVEAYMDTETKEFHVRASHKETGAMTLRSGSNEELARDLALKDLGDIIDFY